MDIWKENPKKQNLIWDEKQMEYVFFWYILMN
jgi:hypothetical protein